MGSGLRSSMTRRQFFTSSAAALAASSLLPARAYGSSAMNLQESNRGPHRVIIDTDPGVDDALALLLAMR